MSIQELIQKAHNTNIIFMCAVLRSEKDALPLGEFRQIEQDYLDSRDALKSAVASKLGVDCDKLVEVLS